MAPRTCPSCPQLAIVFFGSPMFGAHATSLTQSVCPASASSSCQPNSPYRQICGKVSGTGRACSSACAQ